MSHHVAWIAAILVLLLVLTRRRDAGPVHVVKRSPAVAAGALLAGAGVLVWARGHRAAPARGDADRDPGGDPVRAAA